MVEEDGLEEWDADFLDQAIQVEELALSAIQNPTLVQPSQPIPPQRPAHKGSSNVNVNISFSPPRELSQRHTNYNDDKKPPHQPSNCVIGSVPTEVRRLGSENEDEVVKLKSELGRVSKQLSQLERECLELRKEKDKKQEQLKSVFSDVEAKDTKIHCTPTEHETLQEQPETSGRPQNLHTSHGIGVQTNDDCSHIPDNHDLTNKLLAIWGSSNEQRFGRDLVSKLFVICATDFKVLFGCLNVNNVHSTLTTTTLKNQMIQSNSALEDNCQSFHPSEVLKVSHLYTIFTKMSSGMAQLQSLIEALLDLCNLENVVIVHRSLRILHVVLDHYLCVPSISKISTLYSGTMSWLKNFTLKTTLWISMDPGA